MNDRPKGGAPQGNRNALRHGLRASKLPAGCKYIEIAVNSFRRQIEDAVSESVAQSGVMQAALVHSACRHERRAQLAERWLRINADLPLNERLGLLKTISDATDSRDRCLERLRLDVAPVDPWQAAIAFSRSENESPRQLGLETGDASDGRLDGADEPLSATPETSPEGAGDWPETAEHRIQEPAHHER